MAQTLANYKNLGPKSAAMLERVGIQSVAELEALGAVAAYKRVLDSGQPVSLNLLYAIQAGMLDLHWTALPPEIKMELKRNLEA